METCQKGQRLCGHPETSLKTERAPTVSFMEPPSSLLFQFFAPSPFMLISFTRPASLAKSSKRRQTCEQCCVPRRWPPVVLPARQDAAHARGTRARPGGGPQDTRASTQSQATPATAAGDAAGREDQHCKQNSSSASCQPKRPLGQFHLFFFNIFIVP